MKRVFGLSMAVCKGLHSRDRLSYSLLQINGIQKPLQHTQPASPRSVKRCRISGPHCGVDAVVPKQGPECDMQSRELENKE